MEILIGYAVGSFLAVFIYYLILEYDLKKYERKFNKLRDKQEKEKNARRHIRIKDI